MVGYAGDSKLYNRIIFIQTYKICVVLRVLINYRMGFSAVKQHAHRRFTAALTLTALLPYICKLCIFISVLFSVLNYIQNFPA